MLLRRRLRNRPTAVRGRRSLKASLGPAVSVLHFAPVLCLTLSCLMRQVRAWPNINSPSAMAAAAGATRSVPSAVTFWYVTVLVNFPTQRQISSRHVMPSSMRPDRLRNRVVPVDLSMVMAPTTVVPRW